MTTSMKMSDALLDYIKSEQYEDETLEETLMRLLDVEVEDEDEEEDEEEEQDPITALVEGLSGILEGEA